MATISGIFGPQDERVQYEITDEKKDLIVEKLLDYYREYCHFGEGIMQDDNSLIFAAPVLADIADDVICFEEM